MKRIAKALLCLGMTAGVIVFSGASLAAKPARCAYGQAQDGSTNCMSKSEFEITRTRQALLDADPAQYLRNGLVRCERLNGDYRKDCIVRINGGGSQSGSVEGGGIYRELITIEVIEPGPMPAPPAKPLTAPK